MAGHEPVYFIGGTFGAGTSGWIIAILTALATSIGAFAVGYFLEGHKRRRDVRALAEAFIAEITTVLRLLEELHVREIYTELLEKMQKQGATWEAGMSADSLTFPITVYEKCADRVGTLGAETGAEVVRFYNALNGFRTSVRIALGSASLPMPARIEVVKGILRILAQEAPRAKHLVRKLRGVADRNRLGYGLLFRSETASQVDL
jgi:hypothetical protein